MAPMQITALKPLLTQAQSTGILNLRQTVLDLAGAEPLFTAVAGTTQVIHLTDVKDVVADTLPYRLRGTLTPETGDPAEAVLTFDTDQTAVTGLALNITTPETSLPSADTFPSQTAALKTAGATTYALRHSATPHPGTTTAGQVAYTTTIAGNMPLTDPSHTILRLGIAAPHETGGATLALSGIPDTPVPLSSLAEGTAFVPPLQKIDKVPDLPRVVQSSKPHLTGVHLVIRNDSTPCLLTGTAHITTESAGSLAPDGGLPAAEITAVTADVTALLISNEPAAHLALRLDGTLATLPWTGNLTEDRITLTTTAPGSTGFGDLLPGSLTASSITLTHDLTTKAWQALLDIPADWTPGFATKLTGIQALLSKPPNAPLTVELTATANLGDITAQASATRDSTGGWALGLYAQNLNPRTINDWLTQATHSGNNLPQPITTNGDLHTVLRIPKTGTLELSFQYTTSFTLADLPTDLTLTAHIVSGTVQLQGLLTLYPATDSALHRMDFELDTTTTPTATTLTFTWQSPAGIGLNDIAALLGTQAPDLPGLPPLTSITLTWNTTLGIAVTGTTPKTTLAIAVLNKPTPHALYATGQTATLELGKHYKFGSYTPWEGGSDGAKPLKIKIAKELGAGGFGTVYLAENLTGVGGFKEAALKIAQQGKGKIEELRREYDNLKGIGRHQNVNKSYGSAEPVSSRNIPFFRRAETPGFILFELIDYTLQRFEKYSSLDRADKANFSKRLNIATGWLNGLIFMHSKGYAHGDVAMHPGNLFIRDSGDISCGIIGDLGQARREKDPEGISNPSWGPMNANDIAYAPMWIEIYLQCGGRGVGGVDISLFKEKDAEEEGRRQELLVELAKNPPSTRNFQSIREDALKGRISFKDVSEKLMVEFAKLSG
ncbi:protein kinase [Streptomyces sp. NPDC055709]